MRVPISSDLQKAYRDTLDIPSAPMFIDTDLPVTPVAVIAQAVNPQTATYSYITDGTNTAGVTTNSELSVSTNGIKLTTLTGTRTTAGTTTLGTVPASKKWRIYGAILGPINTSTSDTVSRLVANSIMLLSCVITQATGVGYATLPTSSISLSPNYMEITTGQTVDLINSGAGSGDVEATVWYVEVNA